MKINEVNVSLTGEDMLSIFNDFVKVDGLIIENINLEHNIAIRGIYKKIITIPFIIECSIFELKEDILILKLSKAKVLKLTIFKPFKKLALKFALKTLKELGITSEDDGVKLELSKLLKVAPFLKLHLNSISINEGNLNACVQDIGIDISRIGEKPVEDEPVKENEEEFEEEIDLSKLDIEKINDKYTEGREFTKQKLPKKAKPFSEYLLFLPDILALIFRLIKDERVPKKTKGMILGSLAYISFPLDILPDRIPFIGKVDDVAVVFFTLNKIVNEIPIEVILENWGGKNEFIMVLKEVLNYLTQFTGAENVEKIYNIVDDLVTT